MTLHEAIQEVL